MVERDKDERGFAAMPPEKRSDTAGKGGSAAHEKGTAHEWTAEEAKEAGQKGGKALFEKLGREHMAKIGARGGAHSHGGGRRRRSLGKAYVEED